jgi:hypothetical protein
MAPVAPPQEAGQRRGEHAVSFSCGGAMPRARVAGSVEGGGDAAPREKLTKKITSCTCHHFPRAPIRRRDLSPRLHARPRRPRNWLSKSARGAGGAFGFGLKGVGGWVTMLDALSVRLALTIVRRPWLVVAIGVLAVVAWSSAAFSMVRPPCQLMPFERLFFYSCGASARFRV